MDTMTTNGSTNGNARAGQAEETVAEAYGASQIGPFDYVPQLGYREYWYPGIETKRVGKKPVYVKMLGDDLVLFRGKNGKVAALSDWCPHRGARLSLGVSDFDGTVTCPYHGYVFDGTGQCVAGLIDSPTSPFIGKLKAKSYPTEERFGIVMVWMGETEPVPVEDDMPAELFDESLTGRRYMRTRAWNANWTEPVAQGIDFHEFYLHRGQNIWRIFNKHMLLFRPKVIYTGGVKIVEEGEDYINTISADPHWGQAYYPNVDDTWPRHVWWRKLKGGMGLRGKPWKNYNHNVELPSVIRTIIGPSTHIRWMVPMTEDETRVWTFTIVDKPKTMLGKLWQDVWYYLHRKWNFTVWTNEKEDLIVFQKGHMRFDLPQKLGPLDVQVIYWRRHLALRARDYQRLGRVRGALKEPPQRVTEAAENKAK